MNNSCFYEYYIYIYIYIYIYVNNAEEGGGVVILDIKDYIDEANRQLNNIGHWTSTQQSYILKK